MRVAHLTATYPPYPGGAGNTAHRIATNQAQRGHEVEVFTAPYAGKQPNPAGTVIHRNKPLLSIGNAPLLPSLLGVEDFDIVHLHYPFIFGADLTLLSRLRRRARSQALIVHYKNRLVGEGGRGLLFEAYERTVAPALIRAADRVMILSPDHADSVSYLRAASRRNPKKLVEMPNGVDSERFSPGSGGSAVRERLGIPENAVVAAFVATLDRAHHFKRLDIAIDALAGLGPTGAHAHLLVAGGGDLLEDFRARAAAAGIGDRTHFLGSVPHDELPNVLRASDLFVFTTEPPESFGIVLAEAMATGLPTIVTEYPGVAAVVSHGETGLIVPRGDVNAVRDAIAKVVTAEPAERHRMGAVGRKQALEKWSWPNLLDRIDDVYGQALAVRKAKTSKSGRGR